MSTHEEAGQEGKDKKPRTRSPNYPQFGLEVAIEKIDEVYKSEDRHWTSPEAVASHLKMSPTSSSFMMALGALKQFGLVDDQGAGAKRKVRVSDLGFDLVERTRDTDEWKSAAKVAALLPKLHAELWAKYGGRLPPKDESIRIYLLKERPDGVFNKTYVDSFIEQFRATVAFSNLGADDKISDQTSEESDTFATNNSGILLKSAMVDIPQQKPLVAIQQAPGTKREVFTLAEGDVLVQWPARLSASSFQDLEDHLNLILRKVKRSVAVPTGDDELDI